MVDDSKDDSNGDGSDAGKPASGSKPNGEAMAARNCGEHSGPKGPGEGKGAKLGEGPVKGERSNAEEKDGEEKEGKPGDRSTDSHDGKGRLPMTLELPTEAEAEAEAETEMEAEAVEAGAGSEGKALGTPTPLLALPRPWPPPAEPPVGAAG